MSYPWKDPPKASASTGRYPVNSIEGALESILTGWRQKQASKNFARGLLLESGSTLLTTLHSTFLVLVIVSTNSDSFSHSLARRFVLANMHQAHSDIVHNRTTLFADPAIPSFFGQQPCCLLALFCWPRADEIDSLLCRYELPHTIAADKQ
mmetsp:Transcript_38799/g.91112  ORF Transcript_38799/g.91112 Transcript_38799/m.91112 type:complete len:151 (+) Transcript_38799:211-663(+)